MVAQGEHAVQKMFRLCLNMDQAISRVQLPAQRILPLRLN
jgi:hypothetical protein